LALHARSPLSNTTAAALIAMAGPWPVVVQGSLTAHVGGGQSGAGPTLRGQAHRFVQVLNPNDSAVLPSLSDREESARMVFVVNDGNNALSVYCAVGDTMNGVANAALSIPAGGFGVFLKVDATLDWRASSFT
jgi:hypothetical protein